MDITAILSILPHRFPFLLVDRVDERNEDTIVARKMVSMNEPFFSGHFPLHPIMPGVLIIEALAQAGALLAAPQVNFNPAKQAMYFMSMDKVKFRKPVIPGDLLILNVTSLRKGSVIWKMRGKASVDGVLVAEAEFIAGIREVTG